jgi:uncharacterized membrane protein YfcA
MMLSAGDLVLVCLVVLAAAFLQTVSGFGFALFVVPLFGLFIDVKVGVVISTLAGLVSSTHQAVKDREGIDRPLARRLIAASLAGMPIGLLVLVAVSSDTLRVVIGLLVILSAIALARGLALKAVSPTTDRVAGFVSGVLATSASTNGPPLVVLLQGRNLPAPVFRPTVNTVFVVGGAVSLSLYAVAGRLGWREVSATLIALPGLAIGITVGRWARNFVSPSGFRLLVLTLLAITGVTSTLAGLR